MARRKAQDIRTEADWRGFYRDLAIGAARRLGILPIPQEVQERLDRESRQKQTDKAS